VSRNTRLAGWKASASPGAGCHARDEHIEVDSIVPRLYLAARLLQDLGAGVVGR